MNNAHEPNPVGAVIGVRTGQVTAVSLPILAGLWWWLSPRHFGLLLPWIGPTVALGLSAYFVATFHAQTRFPGARFLRRLLPDAGNAVALTFDDGPHPETTPRLLDLLADANAKATFFLVGERAAAYPDLVRRIHKEGHCLGIHGWHHRTMVLQSAREIAADLAKARRCLEDTIGEPLPALLVRPPYGFKTWTLTQTIGRLGGTLVGWSLDPRDYDAPQATAIAERVRTRLGPGEIILLHERPGTTNTLDALPEILRACAEKRLCCRAINATRLNSESSA